jgi:nucleotide-binding universal stress UspA family protein
MFRNIVVAIDTLEPSSWAKALPAAIALAKSGQARLTLATVIPDLRAMIEAEWSAIGYRQMIDSARAKLGSLSDAFPGAAIEVGTGSIWRGIIEISEQAGADLIVLASHRPEMRDYLIGANAVGVVRHAPCSVLVVRD